jgi:hypothetical protein
MVEERPGDREKLVDSLLQSCRDAEKTTTAPTSLQIAHVLPAVRSVATLQEWQRQFGASWHPVTDTFAEGLCVTYLEETNGLARYVVQDELTASGLTLTAFRARLAENVRPLITRAKWVAVKEMPNCYMLYLDGSHESCLIASDDFWSANSPSESGHDLLMIVPSREMVLVSTDVSPRAIQAFRELAQRASAKCDHPVSGNVFIRKGNSWGNP